MKIVSVEEMRAIEQAAVREGVTIAAMMEQAGAGIARAIEQRADVAGKHVVVLCGTGHNGGDGLVAGLRLAEAGADVKFYLLKPRPEDDPHLLAVRERGLFVVSADADQRWRVLDQLAGHADIVIDALVGTGARLPLSAELGTLLDQVKRRLAAAEREREEPAAPAAIPEAPGRPLIVAVDCPSGLDADTGALDPHALPADLSVTMAFPKRGMLCGAGVDACGELVVAGIGLPSRLKEVDDLPLEMVTAEWVRARLPRRPASGHKDTFGRVFIVAGSLNYTGAAALAGSGAFRVGAGLVQLGIPGPLHAAVASRLPEATFLLLPHDRGALTVDAASVLQKELGHFKVLLIGPGLGREDSTAEFIDRLLGGGAARRAHIGFLAHEEAAEAPEEPRAALPPLVVDADGLNLLAEMDDWPRRLPGLTVLTPHAGEMARLLKIERDAVQVDRVATAQRAAKESGHVVVLKGAYTVVAAPDGHTVIEPWANSGLAHAGTGDVLSGAIAGLLAQGLAPFEAAACGAYLHGLAGALAREEFGAAGMLAGDVAQALADAVALVYGE